MAEKKVVIKNKTGLHARPAALFVQKAGQFSSDVSITLGDKEVNAKSIMGVMSLGAGPGSEILIKAEGEDAQQAVDTLAEIIASFSD
ncbi:MAG: HPr family phosphocarrier protein [Bacillota bacterium]|jgi:phosphocarrier protein HPr|nr:HPr family phosphocarrier protein [Bacillota bacterium]HOC05975.1 HPr family phosphocarrier protein [Bacillota bacterium]HPZ22028.1 HPr family phosphocarrier protein [Bacillota bacterium]HQD19993.1 HPr family phosphocarrier protein [Bacillota bacterium]